MKLVTFSGPPSSGKTSVILKLSVLLQHFFTLGVVKFDCLNSHDGALYKQAGIPIQTGISGTLCPDHFFASNIGACMQWGRRHGIDVLVSESAGLCNRCSPHLRGAAAVCVIDILSGIDAPRKIGPMLKLADFVVITKSDLVSQAEREVFALHTIRANPRARILFVNGLTGQGIFALGQALHEALNTQREDVCRLRFSMPAAVCSYCFGETQIGEKYATGNIKYMHFSDEDDSHTNSRVIGGHELESSVIASTPNTGTKQQPSKKSQKGSVTCLTSNSKPFAIAGVSAPTTNSIATFAQCSSTNPLDVPFGQLVCTHPVCLGFFDEIGISRPKSDQSMRQYVASIDEFDLADCGMSASELEASFDSYLVRMESISATTTKTVKELTIFGGVDKAGEAEEFTLTIHAGEMVCIVGPTGSGKSRLLEDVEYLAQGDTPTKRRVIVDGCAPQEQTRHSVENKIVAQLSQSMVFVMDLPVNEFLRLHAESRMMPEQRIEQVVEASIACANNLSGEPFSSNTSLTVLSGGQSRALMIADLAFISASPIVLIDEIENAGVDRRRALELLTSNDKIVLAVTHDPLIALMGDKRLIIGGGGVRKVIAPTEAERQNASILQATDQRMMELRGKVRAGEHIDFDVGGYLGL